MKKVIVTLGSAVMGLAVCLCFMWAADVLGLSALFPSPAGEDDYSVRLDYFVVGVCPSFLLLGAWIGYTSVESADQWSGMWAGTVAGSLAVFVGTSLLYRQLETLTASRAANHAVLLFFVAWVIFSVCGAALARDLYRDAPAA